MADWDGSHDADFRCQGCGQASTVPRLLREDALLLSMKASMMSFSDYKPVLERMSWPRGPLHPNHRLVLNAEFSAWIRFHSDLALEDTKFTDGQ